MTRVPWPANIRAAVTLTLGALLAGCAQLSPPTPREGEDPFNRIRFASYASVASATRGVSADTVRIRPRWIFMPRRSRPPRTLPPFDKIHPELKRRIAAGLTGRRETLMVTFEERVDFPRFPAPARRLLRSAKGDSLDAAQLNQRTRTLIDSLSADRSLKYAADSLALVTDHGASVLRTYWLAPSMLVYMPLDSVPGLARRSNVVYIRPNVGNPPPANGSATGGDVGAARKQLGADHYLNVLKVGHGWIAILDTGVRTTHRLLRSAVSTQQICTAVDCLTGSCDPKTWTLGSNCASYTSCGSTDCDTDNDGHGTSTAAILVGAGHPDLDDPPDRYNGMTWASLDCFRVYDGDTKKVDVAAATDAFQLAIDRQNTVILAEMQETTMGDVAIEADNAYKARFAVVATTGDFEGQVGVPASGPRVMGVADYKVQDAGRAAVTGHSAGPVGNGRFKPDFIAPSFTNTAGDATDDAIHMYTATSGAAPYAAGAALLLRDWMTLGKMDDDAGHVFAQLILAGNKTGPFVSSTLEGAGPISLPADGSALWGKTWVSWEAVHAEVPIEITEDGITRIEAAIWWPEETVIVNGVQKDTHNDVDLELRAPGLWNAWLGPPAAESASDVGVFERAAHAAAAGMVLSKGKWLLRIKPKNLVVSPQVVYWALRYR